MKELYLPALNVRAHAIEAEGEEGRQWALLMVNLRARRRVAPPTLAIMSEEAFREMWPNGDYDGRD